ncbi:hypothetical protein QBC46DRAFT_414766, partial [Diplogelasinospora grovesii]
RCATTKKNKKDKKSISAVVEEPKVEEPVKPTEPDLVPVDDGWGVIGTKRKKKKKAKCAVAEEPKVEEQPAEPEPMPEPEKEDGTTTGNTTGGGLFSGGSATGTAFGATNNAAVGDPPGTASVVFTPTTEKEANNPSQTQSFQNILLMDAYERWSSEELRLADYNQGRKQGSAGGTGAFGAFGFGNTGFGANTQTNTGFGTTTGTGMFRTSQPS